VVVAVALVRVMEMAGDHVVEVIAVADRLVAAIRAVPMFGLVLGAIVLRGAAGRVRLRDRDLAH
jgi:hypothetical protein